MGGACSRTRGAGSFRENVRRKGRGSTPTPSRIGLLLARRRGRRWALKDSCLSGASLRRGGCSTKRPSPCRRHELRTAGSAIGISSVSLLSSQWPATAGDPRGVTRAFWGQVLRHPQQLCVHVLDILGLVRVLMAGASVQTS